MNVKYIEENKEFGYYTYLNQNEYRMENSGKRRLYLKCLCVCGKIKWVRHKHLKSGAIKSCGCQRKVHKTHGMRNTRIYNTWCHIKSRINNKNDKEYGNYGGRGISYDSSWEKFENFYEDMKDGYSDDLTIERIDVNGNYCKENCKWIPMKEQAVNRRNTIKIKTEDGVTSFSGFCRYYNLSYNKTKYAYDKNRITIEQLEKMYNKEESSG